MKTILKTTSDGVQAVLVAALLVACLLNAVVVWRAAQSPGTTSATISAAAGVVQASDDPYRGMDAGKRLVTRSVLRRWPGLRSVTTPG